MSDRFEGVVCWDPARVPLVMGTEALQPDAASFLATHFEMPLFRSDSGMADTWLTYNESRLLHDFLSAPEHALVAILGGAGTGKSHLARWLHTRLPNTDHRRSILVPRSGTSLHDIIWRIMEGAEGPQFDEYRARLTTASHGLSLGEAKVRLLNNLAIATSDIGTPPPDVAEADVYFRGELPYLLGDVVFREYFLRDGGLVDLLARQVIGLGDADRVTERRGFTPGDLPLEFRNVQHASRPAQEFYRQLSNDEALQAGVCEWLNRHLNGAISELVSLNGADLKSLMQDVRIALAADGVELVLLIEDLATLQGIDQQLLEALIVQPRQEGVERLCVLRTVVAMTTGYYDDLWNPIKQRFTFRVSTDLRTGDMHTEATPQAIRSFTARYLNAARLKAQQLSDWYSQISAAQTDANPPNACSACQFHDECHAAFGSADGLGLYPLSDIAAIKVNARVNHNGFNPRTLLKEAIEPLLVNYVADLRGLRFPPPELSQRFRAEVIAMRSSIILRDDPEHAGQRLALLDLWSDTTEPQNLDPVIHKAFGIAAMAQYERGVVKKTHRPADDTGVLGEQEPAPPPRVPDPTEEPNPQIAELEKWNSGGTLSQTLAGVLRPMVFYAVCANIDWNTEHLSRSKFAGASAQFKPASSVAFARQYLAAGSAAIQLPIPLFPDNARDAADATLALQGLLLSSAHGSWAFRDGGKYYRAYLRQLDAWTRHVVAELHQATTAAPRWNPVPAMVEELAVGARLFGQIAVLNPEVLQVENAIFTPLADEELRRAKEWTDLTVVLRRHHGKVQSLLLALVPCAKGRKAGSKVLDAARVLPTIVTVNKTWEVSSEVPSTALRKLFEPIQSYRSALDQGLAPALQAERIRLERQRDTILSLLGEAVDVDIARVLTARSEGIAAARAALASAREQGLSHGNKDDVDEILRELELLALQRWMKGIAALSVCTGQGPLLTQLSAIPADQGSRVADGAARLGDVMRKTRDTLRREVGDLESGGGADPGESQARISVAMEALIANLTRMAGVSSDA